MKKLTVRTKWIVWTILGFLFSCVVYAEVLLGSDAVDRFTAKYKLFFIGLFVTITVASLFLTGQIERLKGRIVSHPEELINMMRTLNFQVFLFSLLYFLMDALFGNPYIRIPFRTAVRKPAMNVMVTVLFVLWCKSRRKESSGRSLFITVLVGSVMILQLNVIELIFLLTYAVMYYIFIILGKSEKKGCDKKSKKL